MVQIIPFGFLSTICHLCYQNIIAPYLHTRTVFSKQNHFVHLGIEIIKSLIKIYLKAHWKKYAFHLEGEVLPHVQKQ